MNTLLEKISTINDMILEGKALEAFPQLSVAMASLKDFEVEI